MSSYNMQKGSHLVCGMFMLVGAEKRKYGLEERHVGPRQEKMVNAGHVSAIQHVLTDIIHHY